MHDDEAAPKEDRDEAEVYEAPAVEIVLTDKDLEREDRDEAEVYEAPAVEIALTDKDLEREVHYAGNGSL